MMEAASFDTEESFDVDDASCLSQQNPGNNSPAKRQNKEIKETKITVSTLELQTQNLSLSLPISLSLLHSLFLSVFSLSISLCFSLSVYLCCFLSLSEQQQPQTVFRIQILCTITPGRNSRCDRMFIFS